MSSSRRAGALRTGCAAARLGLLLGGATALAACGGGASSPDAGGVDAGAADARTGTIVPSETADEAALATLSDWRALPEGKDGRYQLATSRDTGVDPLGAPDLLFADGNIDMNHFLCASDDADGPAPQAAALVLALAACPERYVHGFVIGRFEGSGRMARLWMAFASLASNGPSDGAEVVRIYVDDAEEPFVQVPRATFADGSAGEIFAPPFGIGAGDLIAWYYPVVFSKKLIVAIDHLSPLSLVYHQVGVVLDASAQERHAAATRLPARDDAATTLSALAGGPLAGLADLHALAEVTLVPGVASDVATLDGAGVVHDMRVVVTEADLPRLAEVTIEVRWDGASSPAIALPLEALFAIDADGPTRPSLALAASHAAGQVTLDLRLPMPFAEGASFRLLDTGAAPITLALALQGETLAGAPGPSRLHAIFSETLAPAPSERHPVVSLSGAGRLVGVCGLYAGHALATAGDAFVDGYNFLEGDERIVVDGRAPLEGTGTEDYVDAAFYFHDGAFGTAFAQAWGFSADPPSASAHGRVSACRWHVLGDAIDFASSLEMDLEIGPSQASLLDRYRTVAFLYLR
jgi:hypothetical protein